MRNALSRLGDTARRLSRKRITAALLGGALALMLGGGTAVASGHIGSDDIKDGSILRKDLNQEHLMADIDNVYWGELAGRIKPDINKVFTSEIVDGTIRSEDLSDEAKAALQGEKGEKGEKGDAGQDGQDGVSGYEVIAVEKRLAVGSHEVVAECPGDKVAIGGGYELSADGANGANTTVQQSQTTDLAEQADGTWQGTSWTVRATITEGGGGDNMGNVKVVVNCADAN